MKALIKSAGFALALALSTQAGAQTVRFGIVAAPGTTDQVPAPGINFFRDFADALAKEAGFTIEYIVSPFGQQLQAIVDNKLDVGDAPYTITPERRGLGLEFSQPIITFSEALVVPSTDATAYKSVGDLAGQVVATTAGTIYEALITNAGATLKTYPAQSDLIDAVARGEVKAGIVNVANGRFYIEVLRPTTAVRVVETYVPLLNSVAALPVRLADTQLLATLNMGIDRLKANGTLATLNAHYRFGMP